MVTPQFVTVAQFRDHLRMPPAGSPALDDADLQLKVDAATQLVCDYLVADQNPPDAAWVSDIEGWGRGSPVSLAPPIVVLAVLEQATEFYRFRGDDGPAEDRRRERDEMSPLVRNLLTKYHRASFA